MTDTIAALSTAPAVSAIGIIRISGSAALPAALSVFRPDGGEEWPLRRFVGGRLVNKNGEVIDRVLAVRFRAPNSYTGEDLVELHCHGSLPILNAALAALYGGGVRPAEAGEFTKRAFLNGKLDLVQVEAIGDLLSAETEEGAMNAAAQLEGRVSQRILRVYNSLLNTISHFQAVVDYPEEDIDPFETDTAIQAIARAAEELGELAQSFERGKILREGVRCAIIGRPNTGKSSLLNVLVGYDRAIVTPESGTTRDVVEVSAKVGGVMLKLCDTAGLREAESRAEHIGVEKSLAAAREAEFILLVVDGSEPLQPEDFRAMDEAKGKKAIVCINKSDLEQKLIPSDFSGDFKYVCPISAKEEKGLGQIDAFVRELFETGKLYHDGTLLTSARQEGACRNASALLSSASAALTGGAPPDMVLLDVEEALKELGRMLGKNVGEDVLERIFERFCVGK